MHYEATVIRLAQILDVKVYDEELVHHFTIHPDGIDYEIAKRHGELVLTL